jgi:hypothetical protein
VIPVFIVMRSDKAVRLLNNIMERLALLTMIYLVLDIAALIIVIIRNL